MNTLDKKKITIQLNDDNRVSNEKNIFRLQIIGVITDYTIDFGNNTIDLVIEKLDKDTYISNLKNYLQKRGETNLVKSIENDVQNFKVGMENKQYLNNIFDNLVNINLNNDLNSPKPKRIFFEQRMPLVKNTNNENKNVVGSIEETIEYCIDKLIHFVYSKIEPQRRRSLLNLVQAARYNNIKDFRNAVLRYLDPSEDINILFNVFPGSNDFNQWIQIIKKAQELEKIQQTLGVCLRYLESYPDNPGLLYLSIFLRCLIPKEKSDYIKFDYEAFIKFSDDKYSEKFTNECIIYLLDYVTKYQFNIEGVKVILKNFIYREISLQQAINLAKIKVYNKDVNNYLKYHYFNKVEKGLSKIINNQEVSKWMNFKI